MINEETPLPKNNKDDNPDNNSDNNPDDEQNNVPRAVIGVLPVGETIGTGMAGASGNNGGQGAYPGGAALLPFIIQGNRSETEDHRIAQDLETAFAEEPMLSAASLAEIQFTVTDGVVLLTGNVAQDHDRQTVLSIARRVAGVSQVNDQIIVG